MQFSRNSNVGNADRITGSYIGPAGEGRDFAAGFDPANYQTISRHVPDGQRVLRRQSRIAADPRVHRWRSRASSADAGWARATYVKRHATHFVEDFITIDDGQTIVIAQRRQPRRVRQRRLPQHRTCRSATTRRCELESAYPVRVEAVGERPVDGAAGERRHVRRGERERSRAAVAHRRLPGDLTSPSRSFPDGRLDDFQRHKVRVWATYNLDLGRFGRLDVAPLYRYNSGRTYSLVAPVSRSRRSRSRATRVRAAADQPVDLLRRARIAELRGLSPASISRRPTACPCGSRSRRG